MLLINFNMIFGMGFFFIYFYLFIIISIILYVLPLVNNYKSLIVFEYLNFSDLWWVISSFLFLLVFINFVWISPTIICWFGHFYFTSFHSKFLYFIIFFFVLATLINNFGFYLSSREVFDYQIIQLNFLLWILFLFSANSIFTTIFFIEILSTLIFLLILTSNFSTTFFFNNLNLTSYKYFSQHTPFFLIQTLILFFWISLLSSLILFVFIIIFYLYFSSFDWFLIEILFVFFSQTFDITSLLSLNLAWFFLIFAIFLKCGLSPLYFWKPMFFKGLPIHGVFFYILFFYFFIFLFFLHLLVILFNEIFYFFIYINLLFVTLGIFILFNILYEAYYLKSFLALSSILNTLFIFLLISNESTCFYLCSF